LFLVFLFELKRKLINLLGAGYTGNVKKIVVKGRRARKAQNLNAE